MARSEARVQALLDRPLLAEPSTPAEPGGFEVAFEGIGFRYDAHTEWVLRDVSFRAPTASVDPEAQHGIRQAISQLIKGRTVIVIAHRLHTIQHADQILLLAQGQIIERGSHDELLRAEGLYRDMWTLQTVTQ